jgi:phosphate uptake regulator
MVGGGTTYAVSLPKPWIEKQGLSAGDEVTVEARIDGTLILHARKGQPSGGKERTIAIGSTDASEVLRTVIGLYVAGFDTASLHYPSTSRSAVRGGVADACERLHGVQVVEEHPSLVILQDLADPTDFNMDKGLRRMHLLVLQILSNACAIIASARRGTRPCARPSDTRLSWIVC